MFSNCWPRSGMTDCQASDKRTCCYRFHLISPGFTGQRVNFNKNCVQGLEVCRMGLLFPVFSICYIICPWWSFSQTMRKPFIKFICNSSSYFTFLCEFFLIEASLTLVETFFSFTDSGLPEDRGYYGLGPPNRHHQERISPLCCGVLYPGLGGWTHMEWDQAALGRGTQGVRKWPLECCWLHHKFSVRCHHWSEDPSLLWCKSYKYRTTVATTFNNIPLAVEWRTPSPHLGIGKSPISC